MLKRLFILLFCIAGGLYLPYLFGKMYSALIYSKIEKYYIPGNILEIWVCGLITTLGFLSIIWLFYLAYLYVKGY
jgi:hypothetical protein